MATDFTVDRNSKKYVINSDGNLREVANDTPAIEYEGTGTGNPIQYRGMLVEPASTNLFANSNLLDSSATYPWSFVNATRSLASSTFDINGTSVVLLQGTSATTQYTRFTTLSNFTTGNYYTFSVYAKANAHNYAVLYTPTSIFGSDRKTIFRLTDGVATLDEHTSSNAEDCGNGWWRLSITQLATVTASGNLFILTTNQPTNFTASTIGSIYLYGAQVEAGRVATSYIPVGDVNTGANRIEDDISLTGASDLIGQSEGTFYLEVDILKIQAGVNQALFTISDSDSGNDNLAYVYVHPTLARLYWIIRYSDTQIDDFGTATEGISKIAFAYKSGDIALYINGTSVSTDTTVFSFGDTLQYIRFAIQNGTQTPYVNHRAVALYKTRLTDDQLADLTS